MKLKYRKYFLTVLFFVLGISIMKAQIDQSANCSVSHPFSIINLRADLHHGRCGSPAFVQVFITNSPTPAAIFDFMSVRLTSFDANYANIYSYDAQIGNSIPDIITRPVSNFLALPSGNYTLEIIYIRVRPFLSNLVSTCSINFNVRNFCSPISLSNCNATNENCIPLNSGSFSVTANQNQTPYPPYTYSLTGAQTATNTTGVFNNLMTGNYTITVTDTRGNSANCSAFVGLNVNNVVSMHALNLPSFVCLDAPPIPLMGATPGGGTFSGPGIINNVFTALNAGAGTHTLNYDIVPPRVGCNSHAETKILVLPKPPYINRVISATSSTFSDNWPLDFGNIPPTSNLTQQNISALAANDPYLSGAKGIWKTDENFIYVEERKQTLPRVDISEDGTYDNMPIFLWNLADMSGCFVNWRKLNTITKYSPYSYELENRDILKVHSAALYGYKGDLPTAVAANAALNEIAFDGFEEYNTSQIISPNGVNNGNLTILTTSPSGVNDFTNEKFEEYEVIEASDKQAVVALPVSELMWLNGRTVKVFGDIMDSYNLKAIHYNATVESIVVDPLNASNSLITLSSASFPVSGIWKGKISILYTPTNVPAYNVTGTVSVVSKPSNPTHTGSKSLKVSNRMAIEQIKLKLIPGKKYVVSGWVKTLDIMDSVSYRSDASAISKRGISLEFRNSSEQVLTSTTIESEGIIIEGWQRIEGEIMVPAGSVKTVLVLSAGEYETYFDDIRIFPSLGNMQSYVYSPSNYRLAATLDNNNYATLYYYNESGNLFLIKKETEKGIQTIQEIFGHSAE